MTTGQHPKTLRTRDEVASDSKDVNGVLRVSNPRRRELVPFAARRNRDLSRFGSAK